MSLFLNRSLTALAIVTMATGTLTMRTPAVPQVLAKIIPNMNVPMPPGPFASWPPEGRDPAIKGVQSRCMFVAAMAFDNYQGPKEAIMPELQALTHACVAKQMPDDWPENAAEHERSVSFYEQAKKLDPKLPDPDVIAGAMTHPH